MMQYAVYITLPDGHIPLLGVSVDLDVRATLNPDKTPQGGIAWFNGSAHWARSPRDGACGPTRSRRWQGATGPWTRFISATSGCGSAAWTPCQVTVERLGADQPAGV
jgi:hypothetical protein